MEQINNQRNYIADQLELTNTTLIGVLRDACVLLLGEAYTLKDHGNMKDCINRLYNCLRGGDTTTFTNHLGQDGVQQAQPSVLEETKIEYSQEMIAAIKRLTKDDYINLIAMYCQSGKTNKCIELIIKIISDSNLINQNIINVIVCDNNLLLTTQTHDRVNTDGNNIKATKITSNTKKKGEGFKNYSEYQRIYVNENKVINKTCKQAIIDGDINVLTLCNNKQRWEDIDNIINDLITNNHKIVIFVDEADKCLKGRYLEYIKKFHESENVIKIVLVTATPYDATIRMKRIKWIGENFNKEGRLNLVLMDEKHGENYKFLMKAKIIYFEPEDITDVIEYALRYTQNNPPQNGCIDLLPAGTFQETHEKMVEDILPYYDYAIIINGKKKEIRASQELGGKITPLKNNPDINYSSEGISDWLGKWIQNNNAKNKRIFITGYLCIGRGLTYSSDKYETYVNKIIMNHDKGLAEIIQMLSRTSGYTKADPTVVTTSRIWNAAKINHDLMDEITTQAVNNKLMITTDMINEKFDRISDKVIRKRRKCHTIYQNFEEMKNDPESKFGLGYGTAQRKVSDKDGCYMAAKGLLNNGSWPSGKDIKTQGVMSDNPTLEYILSISWPMDSATKQRIAPLNDGRWVMYWYENIPTLSAAAPSWTPTNQLYDINNGGFEETKGEEATREAERNE